MTSHISKLAKTLASNNIKIRKKAQKHAVLLLSLEPGDGSDRITYTDVLGVCKGLYYSLWMQDKLLLQEEVISRICEMLSLIPFQTTLNYYVLATFETMAREWDRLDMWRTDKMMLLARDFFTKSLTIFTKKKWLFDSFLSALFEKVLTDDCQDALELKIHFCTLIGEEVAKRKLSPFNLRILFEYSVLRLLKLLKANPYTNALTCLVNRLLRIIKARRDFECDQLLMKLSAVKGESPHRKTLSRVLNVLNSLKKRNDSIAAKRLNASTHKPKHQEKLMPVSTCLQSNDLDQTEFPTLMDCDVECEPETNLDTECTSAAVITTNGLPVMEDISPQIDSTSTAVKRVSFGKVFRKRFNVKGRLSLTYAQVNNPEKGILRVNHVNSFS